MVAKEAGSEEVPTDVLLAGEGKAARVLGVRERDHAGLCALARGGDEPAGLAVDDLIDDPARLAADRRASLPECLAHGVPLAEGTVKVLPRSFSLLATRSPVETSMEVLGSPALRADLQALETDYDFILFDSPPLLVSPDAQMLLNLVDKSILVIRPGLTTAAEMARALAIFKKEDFVGAVLNRSVAFSSGE